MSFKAGMARAVMTPDEPVWLAGYGSKRAPDGKIHDLWIKALAFEDQLGKRAVLVTCDMMGIPRAMYERIRDGAKQRCGLDEPELMLTFSHNHCGPVLTGDLVDYYPLDAEQSALVDRYTEHVTGLFVETIAGALRNLHPARLEVGYGISRFAANRRENPEAGVAARIERGEKLRGAVDHRVPVLTVRGESNDLEGILFGYACHATTMSFTQWCGDYPGFAQIALEEGHPGATAMFFPGCGADQNPLPRRELHLCARYGRMLAAAVEEVLLTPMRAVEGEIRTAFESVPLHFKSVSSREELEAASRDANAVRSRWARRTLSELGAGRRFESGCRYPIHLWRLGNLRVIGLGAEAVVDYSHMFRHAYGEDTWVCGYSSVLVAYMPSHRVYEEGGYEGGPFLYEYGHPAELWESRVEEHIVTAVSRMARALASMP